MSYFTVVFIVFGTGALAGALSWATRRSVPLDALRRHHEVGGAVFLQFGVIFAVLLAFVFSEVWSEYNTAAQAINQECGSLHGVAILAEGLPEPGRTAVLDGIQGYLTAVIDTEWPAMTQRRTSRTASTRFRAAWTAAIRLAPTDPQMTALRSQILTQMAMAHQDRETRLFQMNQAVPGLLWMLLVSFRWR